MGGNFCNPLAKQLINTSFAVGRPYSLKEFLRVSRCLHNPESTFICVKIHLETIVKGYMTLFRNICKIWKFT